MLSLKAFTQAEQQVVIPLLKAFATRGATSGIVITAKAFSTWGATSDNAITKSNFHEGSNKWQCLHQKHLPQAEQQMDMPSPKALDTSRQVAMQCHHQKHLPQG
jgi:hypothetical protein